MLRENRQGTISLDDEAFVTTGVADDGLDVKMLKALTCSIFGPETESTVDMHILLSWLEFQRCGSRWEGSRQKGRQ